MIEQILPILLALSSAGFFALSNQLQGLGLRGADARTGSLLSLLSSAAILWLLAPFYMTGWYWLSPALLIFASIGLIRPVLSTNLAMMGIRLLGPTLTSTLASTSPLFAAFFGIVWLGEQMTWPIALGTVVIIVGVMTLAGGGRLQGGWPVWALALPVGAAFIRSLGHAMTKLGMESVPSPMFAAVIGVTVSVAMALATRNIGRKTPPAPWNWRHHRWFLATGLANTAGLLSLNWALKTGDIIAVVPIVACSPVITLLLSLFVFRLESITARKVLAMSLILPAILLIAVTA